MNRTDEHGPFFNKSGKTSIQINEFTYRWVIENVIHCRDDQNGECILSPTFSMYNRNDKFVFQLKAYPTGRNEYYNSYFCLDLKVISCPTGTTKVAAEICIIKEINSQEAICKTEKMVNLFITRGVSDIQHASFLNKDVFDKYLSDDSLTIKFRIRFRNSITYAGSQANPDSASAISKQSILEDFGLLLKVPKFSDVTVVVGDKEFPTHKNILSARCRVFAAMFDHEMKESKENVVKFDKEDPVIMAEVLHFIYTGNVRNIGKLATDLLAAADRYHLDALRLMCEEAVIAKLSLENVGEILKLVDLYETTRLHKSAMTFLATYGSEFAATEDYDAIMKSLSPASLLKVTKVLMQRP
ncbi:speckle-type POZ protein-like [Nasonia vitripennis]|uniref:Uncharacterized protein n=1 Tax=Nasonia vitripennis TaxID=7425 RepID=A0A7M7HAI4_NASVI|nr:speckle-type POZ protein-like [Nasonia vitripennis]